jgi:hypothetical protein
MAAKKKAKKRTSSAVASPPSFDNAKFEREEDLRTLQRAEEIRVDKRRMSGAHREAKSQMKALKKVQARKR